MHLGNATDSSSVTSNTTLWCWPGHFCQMIRHPPKPSLYPDPPATLDENLMVLVVGDAWTLLEPSRRVPVFLDPRIFSGGRERFGPGLAAHRKPSSASRGSISGWPAAETGCSCCAAGIQAQRVQARKQGVLQKTHDSSRSNPNSSLA